jgi:AP-3 complex subunit delta-1
MLGYDMSWASFHMVEVMSSAKFLHKRAGYLAATLSFQQDTDVLMLTTNLIKKVLTIHLDYKIDSILRRVLYLGFGFSCTR